MQPIHLLIRKAALRKHAVCALPVLVLAVTSSFTLCFLFSTNSQATHSCTAFSISNADEIVVGKNYDWKFGSGMLIVNKRGVSKIVVVYQVNAFTEAHEDQEGNVS